MELSQTLQDLLSSDKFNNFPEKVSTTTTKTITPDQEQSRYDECNRLYILGEFIELFQLLQKYNKLDGNFKKGEISEKWDLLLFKGVISMDEESFIALRTQSALNTESTVGNSISHCLNSKFDHIINTRHTADDKVDSSEEEYTIEYVFGLIQSYYLFNLKHNNKTISSSKNYMLLKKFTNKVLNYMKYLPHTYLVDPFGNAKDNKDLFDKFQYNVFQLVDFYVFELEINTIHKVKNIQLYNSLSTCKVYSYIKDTKYEENITKRLSLSPMTTTTTPTTPNMTPNMTPSSKHTSQDTKSYTTTPKNIENNTTTTLTSILNYVKNNNNNSIIKLYSKYYNSNNITIKTLSIILPSSITLLMIISFFIKLRNIIKRRGRSSTTITNSTTSNSNSSIYTILSRLYNTL